MYYCTNSVNQYEELDGDVNCPSPFEQPEYDPDGNLTRDAGVSGTGDWTYEWDAENRLVAAYPTAGGAGAKKVVNSYDYMGRRFRKRVYNWNTGTSAWEISPSSDRLFVYDQWNVLVEFDRLASPQYTAERTFVWGLDLSNSLHGAGNIGGLLAIWDDDAARSNMLVAADGNGNVTQVLKRADGSLLARFEYDAYGAPLVAAETYAADMPLRFSSKWFDAETGLGYWGYRWYHTRQGRWMSRDPIGEPGAAMLARGAVGTNHPGTSFIQRDGSEPGGSNRYAYVFNAPADRIDPIGLMGCTRTPQLPPPPSPGQICGPIPNPNPTDADCCNAARASCAKGDGGGVICCNGRKVSCSWQPNTGAPGDDIITACTIAHEDDHHNDVSCAGCPAGQICRPYFDPGVNGSNEECSGYWVEIDCLLRHGQTTCHSRGTVQDQIACVRKVEARIKQMCTGMKGNPNCKSFPGICSAYGL